MLEKIQDSALCTICSDIILTPATLACKHQFCCYCIRSIRYKNKKQTILCPLCRREEPPAGMNYQRGIEVISYVLTHDKQMRIFHGRATTINHFDHNQTKSKKFFLLLKGDRLHGDIIWGQGSEHSSYLEQVGRLQGKVIIKQNGDIIFDSMRCDYSNTPYEIWRGTIFNKGKQRYECEKAMYQWYGWGRKSSGDLIIHLIELENGKPLSQQSKSFS